MSPLSLPVHWQLLVLEVVLQPEEGHLGLVADPLLGEAQPRPQHQPLVLLRVDHGVRGLGAVSLVLDLQGVVSELSARGSKYDSMFNSKFMELLLYLHLLHYLKGGGRLELEVTSARSVSSNVSVVIDVEMFLRTRFLIFLCGNDLITRTGSVIIS